MVGEFVWGIFQKFFFTIILSKRSSYDLPLIHSAIDLTAYVSDTNGWNRSNFSDFTLFFPLLSLICFSKRHRTLKQIHIKSITEGHFSRPSSCPWHWKNNIKKYSSKPPIFYILNKRPSFPSLSQKLAKVIDSPFKL